MPESDGCTWWPDGWFGYETWVKCCYAHDQAFADGTVTLQSHIDLGQCVAQTTGGLLMGFLMMIGTSVWWWINRRRK